MDPQKTTGKRRCPCCGLDAHAHWFPPEWMELLEREGPKHEVVLGQNKHGYRTAEGGGLPFKQTFAADMIDLSAVVKSMQRRASICASSRSPTRWCSGRPKVSGSNSPAPTTTPARRRSANIPRRSAGRSLCRCSLPRLRSRSWSARPTSPACAAPTARCTSTESPRRSSILADLRVLRAARASALPSSGRALRRPGPARRLSHAQRGRKSHKSAIGAASLIFGGVLDAFPSLKILLPHAGGSFP